MGWGPRSAWRPSRVPCAPHLACRAAGGVRGPFQGRFGVYQLDDRDIQEVMGYRTGLSLLAAACASQALAHTAADAPWAGVLQAGSDVAAVSAIGGLAMSLSLIHIYVAPIKRALQALAAVGAVGAAWVGLTQGGPLLQTLELHPIYLLAVGPAAAALTGVCFKEALCYGKAEAAVLMLGIPVLCLGHLTGLLAGGLELAAADIVAIFLVLFAARKWTQPVSDDVGDKSVFEYLAKQGDGAEL
ncbi:CPL10 [Auxenochlorella protothecoides x Auxenochlorella symbiontica]